MRAIKFRAWDEVTNTFHNQYDFRLFRLTIDYGTLKLEKLNDDGGYYTLKLMQFTGLKDKNGVEIYEGDIVKHHHRKIIAEVSWDEEITGFTYKFPLTRVGDEQHYSETHFFMDFAKDLKISDCVEVIGNKFENGVSLDGRE